MPMEKLLKIYRTKKKKKEKIYTECMDWTHPIYLIVSTSAVSLPNSKSMEH